MLRAIKVKNSMKINFGLLTSSTIKTPNINIVEQKLTFDFIKVDFRYFSQ